MDWSDYHPVVLPEAPAAALAPRHHLTDVPWLAHERAYCQSTSLQIFAEWRSRAAHALGHINWLMGFTYGAGHLKSTSIFLPYDDPEAGLRFAAPSLGLTHRYFVADDEARYVAGIKAALLAGRPVRIMLDSATLKGRDDYFSPHSVVLVGYDGDSAALYETRMPDRRCPAGTPGLPTPFSVITTAARRVSQMFRYPWVFQFTCFDPSEPVPVSLAAVCTRNGHSLRGADTPHSATGAAALRSLRHHLATTAAATDPTRKDLEGFLEHGTYTRADNAAHLRDAWPAVPALQNVAGCLERASEGYAAMVAAFGHGGDPTPALTAELDRVAALEDEAGRLLLDAGTTRRRFDDPAAR
jgi:hypothetical protein